MPFLLCCRLAFRTRFSYSQLAVRRDGFLCSTAVLFPPPVVGILLALLGGLFLLGFRSFASGSAGGRRLQTTSEPVKPPLARSQDTYLHRRSPALPRA